MKPETITFLKNIEEPLNQLQKAFNDINKLTSENFEDEENEIFSFMYPFSDSFDDTTILVNQWVENLKQLINLINNRNL